MVVFKDSATKDQIEEYVNNVHANGGKVTHRYDIINGFAAHLPDNFMSNLQGDDLIESIEPDGIVTTQ
ncbi:hypothetical protein M378DRAFT_169783 [Amanita muscaria Koide BX008]|uniref:Inhibitor I9 domain-containing protein n=1 Tax=Amanita muscaria (strain Koide BX008) TaxID=946122 RepID=A0A0C2WQX3_AMAMK|nr:hypothetical protein M378DRAFT_169783 [Amanita muscaria Koide BX008]